MEYAMVNENRKVNTPKGIIKLDPISNGLGYPRQISPSPPPRPKEILSTIYMRKGVPPARATVSIL